MKAWPIIVLLLAPLALVAAEAPIAVSPSTDIAAPAAPVLALPEASTETAAPVVSVPVEATPVATPAEVSGPSASVKVAPKDPSVAFKAALWPGIVLHGWGHHVAGDQDTFLNLAGGELFSLVMLGFGLAEVLGPDIKGESKATSQSIAMAGGAFFGLTWAWDVFNAGAAAKRYNAKLNLGLAPQEGTPQLALTTRF